MLENNRKIIDVPDITIRDKVGVIITKHRGQKKRTQKNKRLPNSQNSKKNFSVEKNKVTKMNNKRIKVKVTKKREKQ